MSNNQKVFINEFEPLSVLDGFSGKHFRIPDEILLSKEMGKLRVSLYSYLYIHKGINDIVNFSVPLFLNWAGFKSDSHLGGINDKVLDTLHLLSVSNYISFTEDKPLTRTSCVKITFNTELVHTKCCSGERFAILYLDEIESIMRYKNSNKNDTSLNSSVVLLVFAYLRRCIPRRKNELKPEERYKDGINDRRKRLPEAYNSKYITIADELALNERVISKAVDILRMHKLIVLGTPHRVKNIDGQYRTPDFLFSNYQKRENKKLLATGIEYAKAEMTLKANQMHEYHRQFGINYNLKEVS